MAYGSWFSRLSAHRWEGEGRKGGMGVTWRKHDKHVVSRGTVTQFHIRSKCTSLFFFPFPSFSFVFLFVQGERKNSLSYGVLMLLN